MFKHSRGLTGADGNCRYWWSMGKYFGGKIFGGVFGQDTNKEISALAPPTIKIKIIAAPERK